ncbi:MAG: hypothetical protein MMC33_007068 [Icmadophila ericetorum]|nr:hypothetical protein [Icmadophila ericetorum]
MHDNIGEDEEQIRSSPVTVEDLLARCHALLHELSEFRQHLIEHKKEHTVELRQFRNSVTSELKSLEKLSKADPTAERTIHTLRSSNLPFYSAVWTAAKSCRGLVLFSKRFYWEQPPARKGRNSKEGKPKRKCALVDIVANDGQEWIKVSTITESRLLFEKAKQGWEDADSDSDSDEEEKDQGEYDDEDEEDEYGGVAINGTNSSAANQTPLTERPINRGEAESQKGADSDYDARSFINGFRFAKIKDPNDGNDGDDRVGLLSIAEDLQRASREVFIRYRHPRVRFVLPKITEGHIPEIDAILAEIRTTGAAIQCAGDIAAESDTANLHAIFEKLIVDPFQHFTPTLNVDCTILLALVSDLSHEHIAPEPWFHKAIHRQIDLESKEHLLESSLWPAMGARKLLCTEVAAKRMREIVSLIGTPAEKVRTELLLGEGEIGSGKSQSELVKAFRKYSIYAVPAEWQLPIHVDVADIDISKLPPVAEKVAEQLTDINKSVFLYGWLQNMTTISSNRTVAKLIEGVVEKHKEEVIGPSVWMCPTARSLVGKEKGRRD